MSLMTTLRLRAGAIALGLALGLVGFAFAPGHAQIRAVDQDGAPVPFAAPAMNHDFALPAARLPNVHLAQAQPRDYVEREPIDPPAYRPPYDTGRQVPSYGAQRESYSPPARADDAYREATPYRDTPYREAAPYRSDRYAPPPPDRYDDENPGDGTYSMREITRAGHGFFGAASRGLASVIEYAFRQQGRPNGYILGEDAGGAFVAGLRYGRGTLHTRDAGDHPVFWQGPSIGYDAGGDGSKVMTLVYRLRDPHDIYRRFGGVEGSAYIVGGVGMNFQANGDVVLAPIRTGIGLRMGANIGYLKYTRRPTWNPF
jgi:hypothetical protein